MKIDKNRPLPALPAEVYRGATNSVILLAPPYRPSGLLPHTCDFTVISKKSTKLCLQIHKSMIYYYNP